MDRRAIELRCREFWRSTLLARTAPEPGDHLWDRGFREPVQFWEHHAHATLESVDLEGDYPETNLVVVFHKMDRPQCRYAWRYWLWARGTLDPEPVGLGDPDDIWVPFIEWLDTRFAPSGLPCSPDPVAANAAR